MNRWWLLYIQYNISMDIPGWWICIKMECVVSFRTVRSAQSLPVNRLHDVLVRLRLVGLVVFYKTKTVDNIKTKHIYLFVSILNMTNFTPVQWATGKEPTYLHPNVDYTLIQPIVFWWGKEQKTPLPHLIARHSRKPFKSAIISYSLQYATVRNLRKCR
jgi:hypothetical protein